MPRLFANPSSAVPANLGSTAPGRRSEPAAFADCAAGQFPQHACQQTGLAGWGQLFAGSSRICRSPRIAGRQQGSQDCDLCIHRFHRCSHFADAHRFSGAWHSLTRPCCLLRMHGCHLGWIFLLPASPGGAQSEAADHDRRPLYTVRHTGWPWMDCCRLYADDSATHIHQRPVAICFPGCLLCQLRFVSPVYPAHR